jgi:pimeloyl-ACP methyl ester carboxylesterase
VTIIPNDKLPKRPKGVLEIGWACMQSAAAGRTEHVPISAIYADSVVRRISLAAGGDQGWTLSALVTPRDRPAPWKIVVITGAPSWAEYWSPVLAALPQDREMIVVDRPGYAGSEPAEAVLDIEVQAEALLPLLDAAPGQRVMLLGQSYGAAVAAVMAARREGKVASLAMLSSYLGEPGPTAKWLVQSGSYLLKALPRDLRHAVQEILGQPAQLPIAQAALAGLSIPIHVIHGDEDDFAPIEVAERLALETCTAVPIRFQKVEGANHFLNDGPAEALLEAIEACLPPAVAQPKPIWWARLGMALKARLGGIAASWSGQPAEAPAPATPT